MKKSLLKSSLLSIILIINIILLSSCNESINLIFAKAGLQSRSIPQVHSITNSKEINEELSSFFGDINISLNKDENKDLNARLKFIFVEENEGKRVLQSWIEGKEGQRLALDDIIIDSASFSLPDRNFLKTISNKDFLKTCLFLADKGFQINLSDLDNNASSQRLFSLLAVAYEHITGIEIDHLSVNRADLNDILQLKALKVFPEALNDYENGGLRPGDISQAYSHLIKEVLFENYGLSNQNIFIKDLAVFFDLYHDLYSVFAKNHKNIDYWLDFKDVFNQVLQGELIAGQDSPINRGLLASVYSFIFSEYFLKTNDGVVFTNFVDCEDDDASFCVGQNLMKPFPKPTMFYPEYLSKYYELPLLLDLFVKTCFYENFEEEDGITSYASEKDLIYSYCKINDFFNAFDSPTVNQEPKKIIINDRDYSWHMRQYGTGEYAGENCMPTMTAMALKWVDEKSNVSTEDLRDMFLPEFTSGWWMAQVITALDHYGVPFKYTSISQEKIIEILNHGGIALVMFSETVPEAQGHCEVIYGYEKSGDSLRFIVNDPGFENNFKADGNPYGKARVIDSEYLMWTVERMNKYMVVIPTN